MYVITVDVNGDVSASRLARLTRMHETPQDPCIVVYTEESIPDGYTITTFDGLVEHFVKANPKYADDKSVKKALHEQRKELKKDKFYNP